VYVVKRDNTVEMRKVTAFTTEADRTLVESGLSPGELVVTEGVDRLQPGSAVAVRQNTGAGGAAAGGKSGGKNAL
jgi:multidrug efflux system membrane fusion protein